MSRYVQRAGEKASQVDSNVMGKCSTWMRMRSALGERRTRRLSGPSSAKVPIIFSVVSLLSHFYIHGSYYAEQSYRSNLSYCTFVNISNYSIIHALQ